MIYKILPIIEPAPASGRRTILRPNGHNVKAAILKAANPNGIVMIKMKGLAIIAAECRVHAIAAARRMLRATAAFSRRRHPSAV
jgi:hypothetical protein